MEKIDLLRAGLVLTLRCTLKCKLCAAYAPYYNVAPHYSFDYLSESINRYFQLVNHVGTFSLTGGEALLHENLSEIIELMCSEYPDRFDKLLILTNGTLLPSEKVLQTVLKYKDMIQFIISDYGEVSVKVNELIELLTRNNISHRVICYHGKDLFCDGWVDYGDHSLKCESKEERDNQGENCLFSTFVSSVIQRGQIHRCGRAYRRMEIGVIPYNKEEYVDLFDDSQSQAEKVKVLNNMFYHMKSTTSCAYCNGLKKDAKRYQPAEQIK